MLMWPVACKTVDLGRACSLHYVGVRSEFECLFWDPGGGVPDTEIFEMTTLNFLQTPPHHLPDRKQFPQPGLREVLADLGALCLRRWRREPSLWGNTATC